MDSIPSRASTDIAATPELEELAAQSPAEVEAELTSLKKTHEGTIQEHREELNSHLERIDALQSKLAYLSQQLASSAKSASSSSDATPADKKVAEKYHWRLRELPT